MTHQQIATALVDLGRAMQLAGAAIEQLAHVTFSRERTSSNSDVANSKIEGNAETSRQPLPISSDEQNWPRIGGHGFVAPPPGAFEAEKYLAKYKPGVPRLVYVAACNGLKCLSDKAGIPHNKVSTSAADRLLKRLRELGTLKYGCIHLHEGSAIEESGFDTWKTYHPPRGMKICPNSPVVVAGPAIRLIMPSSMDARQFDRRFDELVQLGSTGSWFETDEGRAHASRMGIAPSYAKRFTRRTRDGLLQPEVSKEIVAFRSVGDFDRLVSIIERVVLEHLGLWSVR